MKPSLRLHKLVLIVMVAPLLLLSACSDNGSNFVAAGATTIIIPGINPAFDSITEVAVSPVPEGPYADVLVADTDYSYDPVTESITSKDSVDSGGEYVRITGQATVTGTQGTYTVYTYIAASGVSVAANELTSAAVGLVASGDAADFAEALGLVEVELGLPAGSVADPVTSDARSAELTSLLAAAAPAYAAGADPAFDVTSFALADLQAGPAVYMDCIALGGLAWDSWHKTDAGGAGLPTAESDNDYTRCKACHGWDQLGTDGGYVFRSRNAGRANAGYQDPNNCDLPLADPDTCTPSRNISTDASFGSGTAIEIPVGGRTWAQGSAVFDTIDPWGPNAILGNRHPDLSAANPEGPTAAQLGCLTAFLNAPAARADQVFSTIETMPADGKPAIYTPVATADTMAGNSYYAANCNGCHGDPSTDSGAATGGLPGTGGLIGYLNSDGKFSEFMHKMHWGIPNTSMSRASMGTPTAADVANVVAYMQAIPFTELSAAQVVPPVAGVTVRGSGTYTLTASGLEYDIMVDGPLSSLVTDGHLHLGRVGTNGDSVHDLTAVAEGHFLGVWADPSPAERTALLAGNVYVNIHTETHIAGEIRGQVKVTEGTGNQLPIACFDVAPSLNVEPGIAVSLDAGCSSDPDVGPSPLTYGWSLGVPVGSTTATLSSADTPTTFFTPDVDGSYTVNLTVGDGLFEATAVKTVTAETVAAGNIAAGLALYDSECSSCHDAGSHDFNGSFAGDIANAGSIAQIDNDLSDIDSFMDIQPTDQQVLDLQAFLNSLLL